jgi:hypothetical protein
MDSTNSSVSSSSRQVEMSAEIRLQFLEDVSKIIGVSDESDAGSYVKMKLKVVAMECGFKGKNGDSKTGWDEDFKNLTDAIDKYREYFPSKRQYTVIEDDNSFEGIFTRI